MPRERELNTFKKLSRLQCFIMVALLDSKYATMPRRQFSEIIYRSCFKIDFPQLMISQVKSARAILSRSYTRLEKRGFLLRSPDGCWKLTESGQLRDPLCETPCGLLEAYRIWDTYREELKACNLKGPSADCPLFKY